MCRHARCAITTACAQEFVKAVSTFNLDTAFPNMEAHAYDWRVDKYEPHRVWFTIRNTGTHVGPLKFFGRTIQPTGKVGRPYKLVWSLSARRCVFPTSSSAMRGHAVQGLLVSEPERLQKRAALS